MTKASEEAQATNYWQQFVSNRAARNPVRESIVSKTSALVQEGEKIGMPADVAYCGFAAILKCSSVFLGGYPLHVLKLGKHMAIPKPDSTIPSYPQLWAEWRVKNGLMSGVSPVAFRLSWKEFYRFFGITTGKDEISGKVMGDAIKQEHYPILYPVIKESIGALTVSAIDVALTHPPERISNAQIQYQRQYQTKLPFWGAVKMLYHSPKGILAEVREGMGANMVRHFVGLETYLLSEAYRRNYMKTHGYDTSVGSVHETASMVAQGVGLAAVTNIVDKGFSMSSSTLPGQKKVGFWEAIATTYKQQGIKGFGTGGVAKVGLSILSTMATSTAMRFVDEVKQSRELLAVSEKSR